MRKIWSVLRASSLLLISIYSVHAQDAGDNGETTQPTISCLGLENPQTEGQMVEFRECIKRFAEEQRSKEKLELIQKKFEASKVLANQHNPDENRKPFVKKMGYSVKETKFRDSKDLMKEIKSRLLNPGSPQPSATE